MSETAEKDDLEIVLDAPETPEKPETSTAEKPDAVIQPDEALATLRQQLTAAENARIAAEARAQTAQQETVRFRTAAEAAEHASISRSLETVAGQIEAAENQLAVAMENGDHKMAAKANTAIAQAAARQAQLEAGKAAMEARRNAPPAHVSPPADPLERELQSGRYSPAAQSWLRAHPDALTNPIKQHKVLAAHHEAVAAGHAPDTPGYFDFVETAAGYRQPVQQPRRTPQPATPPQAGGRQPGGAVNNEGPFRMTPKMQELAKMSGLTNEEWAKSYRTMLKKGEIDAIH